MRNYGDEVPIAAIATTPGNSALTTIRCSGKDSIGLFSSIFKPDGINNIPGNTVLHGWITNKEKKIDEVLVSVFRTPKSYTGEDSLDISCHGGSAIANAVLKTLKDTGFSDALPGEFTFRAFMNGKLDLTQCESVMELVSAKTETGRSHAVSRLSGLLLKEIDEIKKLLVQVLAGAEIFLDYSEDEISADADEIAGMLPNQETAVTALSRLKKLSASWQFERICQEGLTVVIAGSPNAGKSSLFNLLLKEDRSIVTEIPGTTRDWIEAWVSIDGIPIRLVDTAGLRETEDSVEQIGVERSRKLLQSADIVLYLIDGVEGLKDEDTKMYAIYSVPMKQGTLPKIGNCYLFVWNKCDLAKPKPDDFAGHTPICISAKTGEGLEALYAALKTELKAAFGAEGMVLSGEPAIGTVRQKNLVDATSAALAEALALAERGAPLDLITPMLREAVSYLGEITGEVSNADILDEMFSKFCVGK